MKPPSNAAPTAAVVLHSAAIILEILKIKNGKEEEEKLVVVVSSFVLSQQEGRPSKENKGFASSTHHPPPFHLPPHSLYRPHIVCVHEADPGCYERAYTIQASHNPAIVQEHRMRPVSDLKGQTPPLHNTIVQGRPEDEPEETAAVYSSVLLQWPGVLLVPTPT